MQQQNKSSSLSLIMSSMMVPSAVIVILLLLFSTTCVDSFSPSSSTTTRKGSVQVQYPLVVNNKNIRNPTVIFSLREQKPLYGTDSHDDSNNDISSLLRKRQQIKKWKKQRFLPTSSSFHSQAKKVGRRLLIPLRAIKKDDDNSNDNVVKNDDNVVNTNELFSNGTIIFDYPIKAAISNMTVQFKVKWETTTAPIIKSIPDPIMKSVTVILNFLKILWNGWTRIRWYLVTFTAGAVISIAALIVPIQDSVSQLAQPVTLFETILHDLDQAYVEPVDTQKLFETGISAMLQSLDPYTEFESQTAATALSESIDGRYGGVGLVIAGIPQQLPPKVVSTKITTPKTTFQSPAMLDLVNPADSNKLLPIDAQNDNAILQQQPTQEDSKTVSMDYDGYDDEDDDDDDDMDAIRSTKKKNTKIDGVRVVSAFEGYAFDYGLRVGDKLVQVDDLAIKPDVNIEQVRNKLRGQPGTSVDIVFERDGVPGIQTVTIPRSVVRIRDVKLATLVGNPTDGIGYIQLSGFAADAGREVRNAIRYLQQSAEDATNGEQTLQGLILDLRGNPGGLLTSAVDVASLLVPKGSDIVSAKGRGFPGVIYRSRVDPIFDSSKTRLAVLVNGYTASAAEIVSGAIQDLDVGIIVGSDRTFGKGLVQNVEELPYNTALKFTVAKYYTPSGRCIQGIKYTEGGGVISDDNDGRYVASKVSEKDRTTFYTKSGRVVKDGGGVEADYKISNPKASALEITLLRSGIINDFAAEWSKKNELTHNFQVDEDTYRQFQNFVAEKQKLGEIKLEAFYDRSLKELKGALKRSGYRGSERSVENLQARILQDMKNDYDKYRSDIKEDISTSILARYLPESMLIERSIKTDIQVTEAIKLLKSSNKFDNLLAKGSTAERLNDNQNTPTLLSSATTTSAAASSSSAMDSTNNNNNVANTHRRMIDRSTGKLENNGIRSSISW